MPSEIPFRVTLVVVTPRQPTASQSAMSEGRIERYKSDELVSQIASSGSLICNIQESETDVGFAFIFAPYVASLCELKGKEVRLVFYFSNQADWNFSQAAP